MDNQNKKIIVLVQNNKMICDSLRVNYVLDTLVFNNDDIDMQTPILSNSIKIMERL